MSGRSDDLGVAGAPAHDGSADGASPGSDRADSLDALLRRVVACAAPAAGPDDGAAGC